MHSPKRVFYTARKGVLVELNRHRDQECPQTRSQLDAKADAAGC